MKTGNEVEMGEDFAENVVVNIGQGRAIVFFHIL
jgi:hypothetical protein